MNYLIAEAKIVSSGAPSIISTVFPDLTGEPMQTKYKTSIQYGIMKSPEMASAVCVQTRGRRKERGRGGRSRSGDAAMAEGRKAPCPFPQSRRPPNRRKTERERERERERGGTNGVSGSGLLGSDCRWCVCSAMCRLPRRSRQHLFGCMLFRLFAAGGPWTLAPMIFQSPGGPCSPQSLTSRREEERTRPSEIQMIRARRQRKIAMTTARSQVVQYRPRSRVWSATMPY